MRLDSMMSRIVASVCLSEPDIFNVPPEGIAHQSIEKGGTPSQYDVQGKTQELVSTKEIAIRDQNEECV